MADVIKLDGSENEQPIEVKYLTSLALALPVDDEIKHIQLTLVKVVDSSEIRCYMDIVDPTKLPKFKDE